MRLVEASYLYPLNVVRDGEFQNLGYVWHNRPATLVFAESKRWLNKAVANPHVACIITDEELAVYVPPSLGLALTPTPRKTFFTLHNALATQTAFYWQDFSTEIASDAKIHPSAHIAVRNVRIGHDAVIEPNVTILEGTLIGEAVIIRAGCVLGTEGFEFERLEKTILSVRHAGGVQIHDRVELQANGAVSKGIFGEFTEVGEETKADNLVHIAHSAIIGKRCLIAANAIIAGDVRVGDDVWIGPSATIASEVNVGDRAHVALGSVVVTDVEPDQWVAGNFAIPHRRFLRFVQSLLR